MKKSLIGIAGLVVVAAIGVPYITGSVAESESRRLVERLNEQSEDYGTTTIASYERGMRSSEVEYEYELPDYLAAMLEVNDTLKYQCNYVHGITGIDYNCNLRSNAAYQKVIDEVFDGQDPVSVTGSISALGGMTQEIATQPIELALDEGGVFKLAPTQLLVESNDGFATFTSNASLGAMEVTTREGSLSMDAGSIDSTLKPTASGLYEGDLVVSLGSILMVDSKNNANIDGLSLTATSTERGDKMDSSMSFAVDSLTSEGQTIDNISVGFGLLGMNTQALIEYQAFARDVQRQMASGLSQSPGQPQLDPNQMLALLPILEKMLDKDLTIKLALAGDVEGNSNSAAIDLKLLEKTSFTQLSAFLFNPESVLQNMDIRVNSSLHKSIVQGNPLLGPKVANSPLFTLKGDSYATDIKIGADPEVNGEKVSFQQLQGMVLSSAQ